MTLTTWPYFLGLVMGLPPALLGRLHDELTMCTGSTCGDIANEGKVYRPSGR